MIYTLDKYDYGVAWLKVKKGYVTFRVRTNNDAHVLLAARYRDVQRDVYEIVIGAYGNRKSFIRTKIQGTAVAKADTPGISM